MGIDYQRKFHFVLVCQFLPAHIYLQFGTGVRKSKVWLLVSCLVNHCSFSQYRLWVNLQGTLLRLYFHFLYWNERGPGLSSILSAKLSPDMVGYAFLVRTRITRAFTVSRKLITAILLACSDMLFTLKVAIFKSILHNWQKGVMYENTGIHT